MPTLTTSPGIILHYQDLNPNAIPAVILLHGLGATCESWAFQVPALIAQGYRVLIPDLRGFGKSTFTGRSHKIRNMAEDVIALMDVAEVRIAHIVGISMGGTVALQLAHQYPDRIERLVLVNTFARLIPRSIKQFFFFASRIVLLYTLGIPTQAKYVTRRLFPDPDQVSLRHALTEQILQADPQGYRAAVWALTQFNLQNHLGAIKNPTLVITGQNDHTVPPETQKILADRIPQASQIIIQDAGHGVTGEKADEFNQVLIKFLKE